MMMGSEELARVLEDPAWEDLSIAAYNGPSSLTIAGPADALSRFLTLPGIRGRKLDVSHPFHSPAMLDAAQRFESEISPLLADRPDRKLTVPFASTVTGRWHDERSVADPSVWGRGIWSPVRFSEAYNLLQELNHPVVVEIGPQAILSSLMKSHGDSRTVQPSLRQPRSGAERADMYRMLQALSEHVEIAWNHVYPSATRVEPMPGHSTSAVRVETPDPLETPAARAPGGGTSEPQGLFVHPLHGQGDLDDA